MDCEQRSSSIKGHGFCLTALLSYWPDPGGEGRTRVKPPTSSPDQGPRFRESSGSNEYLYFWSQREIAVDRPSCLVRNQELSRLSTTAKPLCSPHTWQLTLRSRCVFFPAILERASPSQVCGPSRFPLLPTLLKWVADMEIKKPAWLGMQLEDAVPELTSQFHHLLNQCCHHPAGQRKQQGEGARATSSQNWGLKGDIEQWLLLLSLPQLVQERESARQRYQFISWCQEPCGWSIPAKLLACFSYKSHQSVRSWQGAAAAALPLLSSPVPRRSGCSFSLCLFQTKMTLGAFPPVPFFLVSGKNFLYLYSYIVLNELHSFLKRKKVNLFDF